MAAHIMGNAGFVANNCIDTWDGKKDQDIHVQIALAALRRGIEIGKGEE